MLCVGGLLAVLLVTLNKRLDLWQRLVGAGVLQTFVLAWAVVPLLGQIQQQPIKDAAAIAKTLSAPLVLWKAHLPSFVTYTQHPVSRRTPQPGDVVLTRIQHQEALPPHQLLFSQNGIVLAHIRTVSSAGETNATRNTPLNHQ